MIKHFTKKFLPNVFRLVLMPAVVGIIWVNCGSDGSPTEPDVDVSEFIAKGWQFFEQTPPDYSSALQQFSLAIAANSESVEAYTGRGWTYSRIAFGFGDNNYTLARDTFKQATSCISTAYDAWEGLAFVEIVLNEYENAITSAKTVIVGDPLYVFIHDTDINITDLKLIAAQAYFYLGNYLEVVSLLNDLQPGELHPLDKPDVLLIQLQNLWNSAQ